MSLDVRRPSRPVRKRKRWQTLARALDRTASRRKRKALAWLARANAPADTPGCWSSNHRHRRWPAFAHRAVRFDRPLCSAADGRCTTRRRIAHDVEYVLASRSNDDSISTPISWWRSTIACSSSLSLLAFKRMLSGKPILPTSCNSAAISSASRSSRGELLFGCPDRAGDRHANRMRRGFGMFVTQCREQAGGDSQAGRQQPAALLVVYSATMMRPIARAIDGDDSRSCCPLPGDRTTGITGGSAMCSSQPPARRLGEIGA